MCSLVSDNKKNCLLLVVNCNVGVGIFGNFLEHIPDFSKNTTHTHTTLIFPASECVKGRVCCLFWEILARLSANRISVIFKMGSGESQKDGRNPPLKSPKTPKKQGTRRRHISIFTCKGTQKQKEWNFWGNPTKKRSLNFLIFCRKTPVKTLKEARINRQI
jgi:hypothetical protein